MTVGEFYKLFVGMGVWLYMETPNRQNMTGCSQAMHVHVKGRHVHCINHSRIVMSWDRLCWLPAIIRV